MAAATHDLPAILAWLERNGSEKVRAGMARFGIETEDRVLGIAFGALRKYGKTIGRDHDLAIALWDTGIYEARVLATFVAEPERVTPVEMERWSKAFDNWGIVDTVCFKLWDQVPHAWKKVEAWSSKRDEFVKRAAFALLACLALHDREADEERFVKLLPLVERAATDDRNFVKKGVSWALRSVGRRGAEAYAASLALAERLAKSESAAARFVGKDALRDLSKPALKKKFSSSARPRRT